MLKKYHSEHIYYDYVTILSFPCFDFVVYYAEQMDQTIPVFPHRHNLYEIFYGLAGTASFSCGGQVTPLKPGTAIIVGKNQKHRVIYEPQSSVSYFALIFDIAFKNTNCLLSDKQEYDEIKAVLEQIDLEKFTYIDCGSSEDSLIQYIYEEVEQHGIGWNSIVGSLFYRLCINMLRRIKPVQSQVRTPSGYQNIALIASKYIHANYTDEITIDMIARQLNVSPRHVNRLFNDQFGASFAHTVNIIRMEYAKQYLISTNDSIERIAARVGLPSGKAMTKLFKAQEKISPAAYRTAHRTAASPNSRQDKR